MSRQIIGSLLRVELLLFLSVWLVYGVTINQKNIEDYGMAMVEAFVDYHRLGIENLPSWSPGDDSFGLNGHSYSNKQPGEGIIGGLAYAHLRVVGFTFAWDKIFTGALVIFFSGSLLMALAIVALYRLALDIEGGSMSWALGAALSCALGTTILPYSGIAQHDAMAPALMVIGFYFVYSIAHSKLTASTEKWFAVLGGFFLGFTLTVSMLQAFMVAVFGLYFLWQRKWRLVVPFTIGGLLGFGPSIVYNLVCFSDPFLFPAIAHVKYAGYARDPEIFFFFDWKNFTEKLYVYYVQINWYAPVLWFALTGLFLVRKERRTDLIFMGAAMLVLVFYVTNITGLGTCTYGPRYLLPMMPLACLGIVGLRRVPTLVLRTLVAVVFVLVAIDSFVINLVGALKGSLNCNIAAYAYDGYYAELMAGKWSYYPLFPYLAPCLVVVVGAVIARPFMASAIPAQVAEAEPMVPEDESPTYLETVATRPTWDGASDIAARIRDEMVSVAQASLEWLISIREHPGFFCLLAAVVVVGLVPIYGILYPPLVDLPEHLSTTKLLWETLTGRSHLDLVVSHFAAYKLFPYLTATVMTVFQWFGISLINIPTFIAAALVMLFAGVVVGIVYSQMEDRSWRSLLSAGGIVLPAVVAIYTACWFIGFVNYVLGIIFVVAAVFFSHQFLETGKRSHLVSIFFCLALAYLAHPFAPAFWGFWCMGRALASLVSWNVVNEWRRFILVGLMFVPVVLYHIVATAGTGLSLRTENVVSSSPFTSFEVWVSYRLGGLFSGTYLQPEDATDSQIFALFLIAFFVVATIAAFLDRQNSSSRRLILAAWFAALIASWIDEKYIPVPAGHWIAYDYRFVSTLYAICTVTAAIVLVRAMPNWIRKPGYRIAFFAIAAVSVFACFEHLLNIRGSYVRFDEQARQYMDKTLNGQSPDGIAFPHTRWHPDGTFVKHYACMVKPDCDPVGTTFSAVPTGDLYPVSFRPGASRTPVAPQAVPEPRKMAPMLQLSKARAIAVDRKGDYYVTDTGNRRIVKFSADGNVALTIDRSASGEFKDLNGVAVDKQGNIYVTDAGSKTLIELDAAGRESKEWRGTDTGFNDPADLAITPEGMLLIVDQGNQRIVKFDPATQAFGTWISYSEVGLSDVTGIAISVNSVYVLDRASESVNVFDLAGQPIREWKVASWQGYPWHRPDVAVDEAQKRVYVTSGLTGEVLVFDLDGNKSDQPAMAEKLNNPSSLALSETGNAKDLLVLNTGDIFTDGGNSSVTVVKLVQTSATPERKLRRTAP